MPAVASRLHPWRAMTARAPIVAVAGSSTPTAQQVELAKAVGMLLAERNAVVLCGGLGGVMDAVATGVALRAGTCIGLLPGTDPADAGQHVSVALATGLGEARNVLLARACQAMIAIGGGFGTLSEIALAIRMGRRVALVDSWDFSDATTPTPPTVRRCESAADAVTWVLDSPAASPRLDDRPPRA